MGSQISRGAAYGWPTCYNPHPPSLTHGPLRTRADARHSLTPHPRRRRPLATHRSGARRPRAGSRRLDDQNCSTAGRGLVGGRVCQPNTQLLLATNLQEFSALDGASPAPSNDLVRGQPDALVNWCPLTRDRHTGHLNGLVEVLLGHLQGDSGDAPLHRPGETHNFLDGPFGVLRAPRLPVPPVYWQIRCPETSKLALDFENKDRRRVVLNNRQILMPQAPRGSRAVDTKYSLSDIRTKEILRGAHRSARIPELEDSLFWRQAEQTR